MMRLKVFKKKKLFLSISLVVALAVIGPLMLGPKLAEAQKAEELTTVRIGLAPYFDFTPVPLAKALGLDRELGINLEIFNFPEDKTQIASMVKGAIDIASISMHIVPPLLSQIPDARIWCNMTQFCGFMLIGRKKDIESGRIKTFWQLEEELGDFKAAQHAFFLQMKGKKICIYGTIHSSTLSAMLANADLGLADMEQIDFADDAKAGSAYARGVGDFYFGSLPQQINLLKDPASVKLVGWEGIGAAGTYYGANYISLDSWIENNKDTVLKMAAIHYRSCRYIHQMTDKTVQIMIDHLNKAAAVGLTLEDGRLFIQTYLSFREIEESKEAVYNPDSIAYWKVPHEYYIHLLEEMGSLEKGRFETEEVVLMEKIFYELLDSPELMAWIKKPL